MIPQFANPLLLWGLAAAAAPILIHLLNRRRYRVQRWAAMEWLLAAARKNQKRLKMENLLLLLLRTCAVLFLALALARPTFSEARLSLDKPSSHLFVLLDNSASTGAKTGAGTVFESQVGAATSLLDDIGAEDPVTLVVTNDDDEADAARTTGRARVVLRGTHEHARFRQRLGDLKPANARADLVEALKMLEETVPATGGAAAKVAILTDLQRASFEERDAASGASPDAAVRATLTRLKEKGAEVILIPPSRTTPDNIAVTSLRAQDDRDIVKGATVVFEAEVRNFGDRSATVDVRFLVDGKARGDVSQTVSLQPRSVGSESAPTATAQFTTTFGDDDVAPHVIEARIAPDALTADDARTFAFEVRRPIKVLAVDGDPNPTTAGSAAETYWLKDAIAIKEGGPIVVQTVDEGAFESEVDLAQWDLVIVANVEHPARTNELRARLERYVTGGGALLFTVGDRTMPDVWNRELWRENGSLLPARLAEPRVDLHKAVTFKLDLSENRHPIFADLTNPSVVSLFRSPTFWGRMSLVDAAKEKGARVVATYDDLAKSPALVERAVGKGRVMLLTTSVDDAWGKLPGDYLYPVLLHEIVYYMTSRGNAERNLSAYQSWTRPAPPNHAKVVEITLPDGSIKSVEIDAPVDSPVAQAEFKETSRLGAYGVVIPLKSADILAPAPPPLRDRFAVNLPAAESDLARMPVEEVARRWPGLVRTATSFAAATDVARPKGGEFHAPMLIAALLCLVLEVLLVRRIAKSRAAAA
jgi:hypothetical protein